MLIDAKKRRGKNPVTVLSTGFEEDLRRQGYPCQPFSAAGKRAGAADPRHLWPDVARVIQECSPEWVFLVL